MPHTMKHGFASTSDHDVAAYLSSLQALVEDQDIVGTTEVQTLSSKTLTLPKINDLSANHTFNIVTEELTASRDVTMRALTGADYFVFESLSQTLANKTLTTPTIASFANAAHTHQDAAGGAKLDHGAALNGLTDDDHTQYALLAGRAGGQILYGGSADTDDLTLYSTSHGTPQPTQSFIRLMNTVDMNSKKITNLAICTADNDAATKGYVDSVAQGLDWQESAEYNINYVKGTSGAPSGTGTSGERCLNTNEDKLYTYTTSWDAGVACVTGDRYVFKTNGTDTSGDSGTYTKDNKIRQYDGADFDETTANEGMAIWMEDEDKLYVFTTSWVQFGSTIAHNVTSGIQGGTSNEYYHLTSAHHTALTGGGSTTLHTHSHGNLGDKGVDDHTQYALLAGRSGGQTLIGGTQDADSLVLRASSGVGTHTGYVDIRDTVTMNSKKIINLLDPADNQDAATKKYVDDHSDTLWDRSGTVLYSQTGPGTDTIAAGSGAVGACGFSFYADQDCGFYYTATQVNVAVAGSQVGYFDANGLAVHSGVVGTPGIRFLSDVDCGFYYTATQINVAIAGVQVGVFSAGGYKAINGTAAAPSIALLNSTTTGFFRKGSDQLGMTAAGAEIGYLSSSGIRMKDGTQGAPAYSFSSNTDCGFYLSTSSIYVSCDNTEVCNFHTAGLTMTTGRYILATSGTAANPGVGFNDESSTGMYKAGPSTLGLTTGGTARLTVGTYGIQVAPAGDVNTPSVQLGGNSDVGFFSNLYSSEDHFVALSIATVEKFRVDEVCATFADEVKVKLYATDAPPDMTNVEAFCFWKDTNDSNRIYLMFKRGTSDVVSVELTA